MLAGGDKRGVIYIASRSAILMLAGGYRHFINRFRGAPIIFAEEMREAQYICPAKVHCS